MKNKIIATILCAVFILSLNVNGFADSVKQMEETTIFNVNNEVFTGYEGMKTTVTGKVGYNFALNTTDNKLTLLLGFTPYDNVDYSIASGWRIKLPYLDIKESGFYRSSDGRGGKTPSNVSCDMYSYNSSTRKYVVNTSGFYNSAIKYMIIKD